ncbi:MAG: patatin-like phospholipase family protein [Hyphomicrobiaceae bacterium]
MSEGVGRLGAVLYKFVRRLEELKLVCLMVGLVVLLAGCAAQLVRTPVPLNLVDSVQVEGLPDVRYWGDALPKNITSELRKGFEQTKIQRPNVFENGRRKKARFLAISGGGSDGAFAAGLLSGWTATGQRPEFDLVTGISTGALAAPFAFLGPQYDRELEEIYTQYSTNELVEPQLIAGLLGGASIADARKFEAVVAQYVDMELLRAIAREYDRGRRLLIGTTNLDAQRPVVWDMGKIAKGGDEKSLELFRNVLRASASIPAVFPPVVIDVAADGQRLQELHVDGGTTGQVFFLPPQLILRSVAPDSVRRSIKGTDFQLYIIMNNQLSPKWTATKATATEIARRSLSTLTKQQAISDLYKVYVEAKNNGIGYNIASVPKSFKLASKEPFDRDYMRALFEVGRGLGRNGYRWMRKPPGL